jgi:hypothetical protein
MTVKELIQKLQELKNVEHFTIMTMDPDGEVFDISDEFIKSNAGKLVEPIVFITLKSLEETDGTEDA